MKKYSKLLKEQPYCVAVYYSYFLAINVRKSHCPGEVLNFAAKSILTPPTQNFAQKEHRISHIYEHHLNLYLCSISRPPNHGRLV